MQVESKPNEIADMKRQVSILKFFCFAQFAMLGLLYLFLGHGAVQAKGTNEILRARGAFVNETWPHCAGEYWPHFGMS